jgi:hypothetical protein
MLSDPFGVQNNAATHSGFLHDTLAGEVAAVSLSTRSGG